MALLGMTDPGPHTESPPEKDPHLTPGACYDLACACAPSFCCDCQGSQASCHRARQLR
jgi:hypothetical protein